MSNKIYELGSVNKKMTGKEKNIKQKTVMKTREEMVAELGEEEVAKLEAEAEVIDAPVVKGKKK